MYKKGRGVRTSGKSLLSGHIRFNPPISEATAVSVFNLFSAEKDSSKFSMMPVGLNLARCRHTGEARRLRGLGSLQGYLRCVDVHLRVSVLSKLPHPLYLLSQHVWSLSGISLKDTYYRSLRKSVFDAVWGLSEMWQVCRLFGEEATRRSVCIFVNHSPVTGLVFTFADPGCIIEGGNPPR